MCCKSHQAGAKHKCGTCTQIGLCCTAAASAVFIKMDMEMKQTVFGAGWCAGLCATHCIPNRAAALWALLLVGPPALAASPHPVVRSPFACTCCHCMRTACPAGTSPAASSSAAGAGLSGRLHRGSSNHSPAQAGPGLASYHGLLQHARAFVKQRRRDIQSRQEAVLAAQADWRAVLSAMEEQQRQMMQAGSGPSLELNQALVQLRQLKGALQQQIHQLNEETRQVKALKAHVSIVPRFEPYSMAELKRRSVSQG